MFTYAVTIGHTYGNVARPELKGQPLSDQMVADFEDHVNELLAIFAGIVEVSRGAGEWQGIPEPNTTVTLRRDQRLMATSVNAIRSRLREFAETYGQDAIALTIGESELITL